jgi:hypothetical protein
MIILTTFNLMKLKKTSLVLKLGMPEKHSFKVSGGKTKPRYSHLGGNPEKVVRRLQSEVPQSDLIGS